MGYLAVVPIMSGKRAFCPGSTGKLNDQRIIEDHMISHYKRLHSAKASVDCSVPKSMHCDVKYTDQKRREQMKKGPQSVRSLSQRSLRLDDLPSSLSRNAKASGRGAESTYFNSGGSIMSSPRFSTSFNCKQIVYPSQMVARAQNCRPSSELSYRSPGSQRDRFSHLCATSSSQTFKSFQDPTQKTYSGDILLKHAHCFAQEKPFIPRTLKTDCKSFLSTYRYYTPASRKGAKEKTPSTFNQPETHHRSKRRTSTAHDSPQSCSVDHEWSDDESNVFRRYDTENKFKANDFFLSSSRVSPEGMKSPIMRKVIEEEEELLCLEFIADVTNEIIQRGIYSDRVLERVFERHIDMNKHRLDEDKMRHLLESLQNDLQKPPYSPVTVLESKERDNSLLHGHKDSSLQEDFENLTAEETSILSFTPLRDKEKWEPDRVISRFDTTPVNYSILENAESIRPDDEKSLIDSEQDHKKRNVISPCVENHQISEDKRHQNCADNDDLDELGRNMAESLYVSEINSSQEVTEQESSVKLSDDEF